MCSRYAFVPDASAWGDFRAAFGALAGALLAWPARPKLAPTDPVPIVVQQPGGVPPQVLEARWGFIPHWWTRTELPRLAFNARSEEAAAKPMWRDALRGARCLVPATHWYEWQKAQGAKIPHRLTPGDDRGFMFAGLWSLWRKPGADRDLPTCVILTMAASPDVVHVHERMPVVLAPRAWVAWLDPATDAAAALELIRRHAVHAVVAVAIDKP